MILLKYLNASLKRRVLLMFIVIGMMLIIDILIIAHYQNKIDQHSKTLTIINRSQSSLEHLTNTAHKIFRQNEFDIKDELLLTSSQISRNIEILIKGGKVEGTSLSIDPMVSDILTELKSIQKNWDQARSLLNIVHSAPIKVDSIVKELVTKTDFTDSTYQDISREISRVVLVPNSKIKNSLSQFTSHKKLIFQDLNNLSTSVILEYEAQRHQYNIALWVISITSLLVIGLFLFLTINAIITPLGKIGYLTTKIANGEDVNIKYNKPDEIGEIVSSVKSLGHHLRQAADFVHHIGEGDLEVTLQGLEQEKNKIGSLANALISMQDKLKIVSQEDQSRNWETLGMAKFAEILRTNNSNLQSLGDAILAEFISYTDANIGCIYVPIESEEKTQLQLIAFYAYDTKKHFSETVAISEGLIGQTFVEKKTTYLLEIPEEYTHIKSGVGTSSPKSILVVPLKVNEDIYGVLEIASFKEITQEQITFIEKVGETIASTIHNVKNAQQTKKLLEDSQQLTEQMKAQEEEMRQNMEELSATQEEVDRKELQTTSTIAAFDRAVATVEFGEDGIISNTNTVFNELSDRPKNSLLGQHLSTILTTLENESPESLVNDLFKNKKSITKALKLTMGDKNPTPVTAHLSLLQSGNALLICYPLNTEVASTRLAMTDLEEELTQNLDMLEVTQRSLNEKTQLIENALIYLEVNSARDILSCNSRLKSILIIQELEVSGKKYTDLLPVSISDMQIIKDQVDRDHYYSGIVSIENSESHLKKIMLYIVQLKDKK